MSAIDFKHKRNMLRVAKPILEVMLIEYTPEERREVLREVIRKTRAMSRRMERCLSDYAFKTGEVTSAYHNPITGTLNFSLFKNITKIYAHELIHGLERYVRNDYILANAIDSYIESIHRIINGQNVSLSPIFFPEDLRPLKFLERVFPFTEYTHNFDTTGKDLGQRAGFIESRTRIPGSGLFYLKLVDSGVSLKEAEAQVRAGDVPGMKEFSQKYGGDFYKNLTKS